MAEETKNGSKTKGSMCSCGCDACMGHGSPWSRERMLLRVLLGLIILILVFWFGVKLGELREMIRGYGSYGNYPTTMMRYHYTGAPGTMIPASGSASTPNAQ